MASPGAEPSLAARALGLAGLLRDRIYTLGVWESNLSVLFPLLAWGVLIHKSQLPEPFTAPWPVLATVSAIAMLWLPRSVFVSGVFAASLALESAWIQPSAVNHSLYLLFMAGGIVLLGVRCRLRFGSISSDDGALEADLFPLLRGGVYVLFGFAVLHKLNHGFLDTTASCAVGQYANLHARFPVLPAPGPWWLNTGLVAATLATEVSIPVLLSRSANRTLALCVAFVFHLVMGLNGHHGFSAVAVAIYVPFLGRSFHRDVGAALNPGARHPWARRGWTTIVLATSALGGLLLAGGAVGMPYIGREVGYAFFAIAYPAIFVVFLAVLGERRGRGQGVEAAPGHGGSAPQHRPRARRLGHPVPVVSVLLLAGLVLNGTSPYLGLKTESAFAMFSNLRTEGDEWNHLFLPPALRVFELQDTLVRFDAVSRSAGALRRLVERDERVVPVQARRLVVEACASSSGAVAATVTVAGQTASIEDLCTSPWADDDRSWIARRLLVFRPVPSINVCRH